jgi:hypothetical protein
LTINRLLVLAVCGAALPAQDARAAAALPCPNYIAGFAARDDIVLGEAARLAAGLIDSAWSSPAMRAEAGAGPTARGRRELVLRELRRTCAVLPRADIQNIVGVLLRSISPPPRPPDPAGGTP